MFKPITKLAIAATLITTTIALTSCARPRTIDSNWKFESVTTDGKTSSEQDDPPIITIRKENDDERMYMVTYRQNGKTHKGLLTPDENGSYTIDFSDSDTSMQAKIIGNTLTLSPEGSEDTVTFKYTSEEIRVPAEDRPGPDYIKVKMVDKNKVEFKNESSSEYMYGSYYQLEVKKDGAWYEAKPKVNFVWTAVGILIQPGQTNTEEYDLDVYGDLKPGDYRLAVGGIENRFYAYFSVNQLGHYSFPD